jgi:hypothetical protein
MPPLAAKTPQPGDSASSTPADDRVIAFLRQKLAGEPLPAAAAAAAHFHDAISVAFIVVRRHCSLETGVADQQRGQRVPRAEA